MRLGDVSAALARGDLWIALAESTKGLCRWTRTSGKFDCYSIAGGADPFKGNLIFSMAEDKAGNLWIGTFRGLLQYPVPDTVAWGVDEGLNNGPRRLARSAPRIEPVRGQAAGRAVS